MEVEVNITGASYTSRSVPLSAQVTRNFYPESQQDANTRSPIVLHSFPGLTSFGSTVAGADRGMYYHNGLVYRVVGGILYEVSSTGVHTNIGVIPSPDRCIFCGIGSNLVIASGGKAYQYDGSTLSEITDTDLESPDSVAHLNNQIIYDGIGGRFSTSDVGDATSIDGLNYATAESDADDLLRVYTFNQLLFLFGEKTTEQWYNSGVGNPPFDRVEGSILPVGIAGIHSASNNDNYIYWLADDNRVYRTTGQGTEAITSIAISHAFEGYGAVSDVIGNCFTMEGQNFYLLTFPIEDKSWCFHEQAKMWFEISSGVSGGKYRGTSIVYAYRKHLVADETSGDLYYLDTESYDENGATTVRVRDTGVFHSGMIGTPGKRVEFNRFELIIEAGVGLVSGQGSDPVIMLQTSDDGGKTWSTEMWGTTGKRGEFLWKVEWNALGSAYNRIFRVRTSDPVFYSIHSAMVDVEVGI